MKTLKYVEAELLELIEQEWTSFKKPWLEKNEVEQVNAAIRLYWVQRCGEVPEKVGAVTELAIAMFETDKEKKKAIIKKCLGTISGLSGIAALTYSISFFAGMSWWSALMVSLFGSILGPIALGVGGLVALVGGGYLLFRKDSPKQASKEAKELLINGMKKVLPELWREYESKWTDKTAMDDEELEFVKRCMSVFIDRKFDELSEAKEGKELEIDDVESLSEQIKKFVREHFGDVPEAFCRKLKDVHDEVYHVLMEKKQPPFRTGGAVCPDLFSSLSELINSFRSTDKAIKALFKKVVEEQLDEMWPEYKDRWKD